MVVLSQNAIVVTALPKAASVTLPPDECRSSIPTKNKTPQIRRGGLTADEKMNVVRHQAVRDNCEASRSGLDQQLLNRPSTEFEVLKRSNAVICANREEITVESQVLKAG
jgi:hypothetical protein